MDSEPDADIEIAGYRIEALVGRGGMGEVYRAVQLDLGRRVALKVLAPELAADERFRRRFLRESRIAASIDHPSIIPIYQTGEQGELLYIAMRYVDGPDLATLLRREGHLEPPRVLAIMTQVASALDAAHARGLVHRDVKPANILLATGRGGADGHCYLCDFGLIKQVDSEQVASALTATDQFVGTIPYVAPEQIEGTAVDGRTDVYSLACVLFQCLTGSVPFEGTNDVEVVFAHLGKPPPALSTRAPALPPAVDPLIARAMAKSKEDRWPTCTALITALTPHLSGRPLDRPPEAGGRSQPDSATAVGGSGAPGAAAAAGGSGGPAAGAGGSPVLDPADAEAGAPVPGSPARDARGPGPDPLPEPGGTRRLDPTTGETRRLDPAAEATLISAPADAGLGFAGPPAPPSARPAGSSQRARPQPGPPVGERSPAAGEAPEAVHRAGPGGDVPATVHRAGPGRGAPAAYRGGPGKRKVYRGGRRRGRVWLTLLTVILLPVAVYVAWMQLVGGNGEPLVAAAPTTVRPVATAGTTCRWTRPEVGTEARSAPLAAIRTHMGWTDRFVVDEMRSWTASDGNWRWYVKAHQERYPSRRGRWLVRQQADGQRLVLALARFTTKGYTARDWRLVDGQGGQLAEAAGCLAGT